MVKTLPSSAGGAGLIPDRVTKIPHASRPKAQNIKQKQYCNRFNKVFTEFVTILVLFCVLFFWGPQAMWDLNSPTRDQTYTPCTGRQSLNHWTTREVPETSLFLTFTSKSLKTKGRFQAKTLNSSPACCCIVEFLVGNGGRNTLVAATTWG